jgi:hypothetical protein
MFVKELHLESETLWVGYIVSVHACQKRAARFFLYTAKCFRNPAARSANGKEPGIPPRSVFEQFRGFIHRAVVNREDLEITEILVEQAIETISEVLGGVETRQEHADSGHCWFLVSLFNPQAKPADETSTAL